MTATGTFALPWLSCLPLSGLLKSVSVGLRNCRYGPSVYGITLGKLPESATSRLITMALEDRDYDVRSESVNSLATLLANDGREHLVPFLYRLADAIPSTVPGISDSCPGEV